MDGTERGNFLWLSEGYKEHIQHMYNAFCRIVIRHAAIDMGLRLRKQWGKEISLDYLMCEKFGIMVNLFRRMQKFMIKCICL